MNLRSYITATYPQKYFTGLDADTTIVRIALLYSVAGKKQ
jgi:hypothetical protein